MASASDLQTMLETLIGSSNVYFQTPESVKMEYPCIRYTRYSNKTIFANDKPYKKMFCYTLVVIDKNPESSILEKVISLPMCAFERHYTSNNLNHDVFTLYY